MLHCDWLGFFTAVIGAFRSSMSLSCFLGSPMSCGLFFSFPRGHPHFRNSYILQCPCWLGRRLMLIATLTLPVYQ